MSTKNTFVHQKEFSIAWGDMDALGHVNNARYFEYFQEARLEWLETMQLHLRDTEGPVLLKTECTFLRPLIYPAKVKLLSAIHSKGHTSFKVDHQIYQGETLMCQASCKIVWINYKAGKSVPLPSALEALFEK